MHWTWDSEKDTINQSKHGFGFETAQSVFNDPFAIYLEDPYPLEERWRTTGFVKGNLVTVIHTWPGSGELSGRIISARRASARERRLYEEGYGKID